MPRRARRPQPVSPSPRALGVAVAVAALLGAAPARAWDSKGHAVIEALAYRTLVEGRGSPPRVDVLRDLVNDGALSPPVCFGLEDPPAECLDVGRRNALLAWPQPQSDRPDAFFRRQFSDSGQCFHYMGKLEDGLTPNVPGREVPRGLATSAVVRCNDLLDELLRQVVVDGGPGTRKSGFGLYELMHVVEDSFSPAHTERSPAGVDFLRIWKPIVKIAPIPNAELDGIPPGVFHAWADPRDEVYVVEGAPGHCERRADWPYDVPFECLTPEGDRARQATAELLVTVRDLRLRQLSAAGGADTHPEASPEWRAYRARWFTPEVPCEGAECATRQPPDPEPGTYALAGAMARYVSPATFEVSAVGSVLRYAEELNPFVYTLGAGLGYQYRGDAGSAGFLGVGLGLGLPLGLRAFLGLTAAEARIFYGAGGGGVELLTRLLRFDYQVSPGFALSVEAPMVVNWMQPAVHWSVGVGASFVLGAPRLVASDTLLHHEEHADREDGEWTPPPAPYGRLEGRKTSLAAFIAVSPTTTPAETVGDRFYGLGALGVAMTWDRDAWNDAFAFTPSLTIAIGLRNTSGDSSYLTGTVAAGVRWYFLGPLGVTVTAAKLEAGPKIRGKQDLDTSAGVQGPQGAEYYLLAGSRAGLALRLGVVDLLVESPTVAWSSDPFGAREILSFSLGIRL
jgi:hypothetical protein